MRVESVDSIHKKALPRLVPHLISEDFECRSEYAFFGMILKKANGSKHSMRTTKPVRNKNGQFDKLVFVFERCLTGWLSVR